MSILKILKNLLLILSFLSIAKNGHTQDDDGFSLKVYGEQNRFNNFNWSSVGISLNYVSKNKKWELDYPFQIGVANEKSLYIYTGLGQALGVVILGEGGNSDFWALAGIISLFIPESITFNFITKPSARLGIYGTAWGYEYRHNRKNLYNQMNLSAEGGLKFSKFSSNDKFGLNAFLGVKKVYKIQELALTGGVGVIFNL